MEISSAESLLSQVRDYQAKIASARRDTGDLGSIPSIGDAGRGQGVDGAAGNFSSRLSTAMVNSLNEVNCATTDVENCTRLFPDGRRYPIDRGCDEYAESLTCV